MSIQSFISTKTECTYNLSQEGEYQIERMKTLSKGNDPRSISSYKSELLDIQLHIVFEIQSSTESTNFGRNAPLRHRRDVGVHSKFPFGLISKFGDESTHNHRSTGIMGIRAISCVFLLWGTFKLKGLLAYIHTLLNEACFGIAGGGSDTT